MKDIVFLTTSQHPLSKLKTYLQLLQRNEITLPALKAHNPELAQEAQDFMQRQMRNKSRGMER